MIFFQWRFTPTIIRRSLFALALGVPLAVSAAPTVTGNTISWPDDGWYQVQRSSDYTTICNGGSSCVVEPGTYKVINHTTGEQFKGIEVSAQDTVQASLELVADKTFRISWQPSAGADFYRVLENPDGISGFSQISDDLEPSTQTFDHRLFNRRTTQRGEMHGRPEM